MANHTNHVSQKCPPGCTCKRHVKRSRKCPPDCTCGLHSMTGRKRCEPGCTCGRHKAGSNACAPGCTCKKHAWKKSAQSRVERNPDGSCLPGCTCGRHFTVDKEQTRNWKGDEADYLTRHKRVWRARGKAAKLLCVDCGGPAREWSQRHGTTGLNVDEYDPRCRQCHVDYDKEKN